MKLLWSVQHPNSSFELISSHLVFLHNFWFHAINWQTNEISVVDTKTVSFWIGVVPTMDSKGKAGLWREGATFQRHNTSKSGKWRAGHDISHPLYLFRTWEHWCIYTPSHKCGSPSAFQCKIEILGVVLSLWWFGDMPDRWEFSELLVVK